MTTSLNEKKVFCIFRTFEVFVTINLYSHVIVHREKIVELMIRYRKILR